LRRISAIFEATLPRCFEGKPEMADLDVLIRDKNGLTELLRVAWRDLANPLLTPFERREARNQIDLYSAELRRQLQRIESARCALPRQSLQNLAGRRSGKPKPRLARQKARGK
jgi:hypothetical protein